MDESDWDKVCTIYSDPLTGRFLTWCYQCWAVNVKGHLHTFREALPTFNANPDGGVFIVSASIAVRLPPSQLMRDSRARVLRFVAGAEH